MCSRAWLRACQSPCVQRCSCSLARLCLGSLPVHDAAHAGYGHVDGNDDAGLAGIGWSLVRWVSSLRAKWGRFQSKPAWTELGSTSEVQSIVADYEKEMARGRQIGHDWLISSCCCEHPISGSAIFGACVHIRVGKFDVEQTTLAHRSISAPVTGRLLSGIGHWSGLP